MDQFCGSSFWDSELTWHTTDPYFTLCFEETALIWLPVIFLMTFAVFDIISAFNNQPNSIGWNQQIKTKCILSMILIVIYTGNSAYLIFNLTEVPKPTIFASAIKVVSYVFDVSLTLINKRHGIHSSGVQFCFWFLVCFCDIILLRSAVRRCTATDLTETDYLYLVRILAFPFVVIQFYLQCSSENKWNLMHVSKSSKKKNPCPEQRYSFFSKLLLLWYDGIAYKRFKTPVQYCDIWNLNDIYSAENLMQSFYKKLSSVSKDIKYIPVVSVIARVHWATFLFGGLLKLIQDLSAFIFPEIVRLLVAHVSVNSDEVSWKGYMYAAILLGVSFLQAILGAQYNKHMLTVGMKIKTTLTSAIYRKTLKLSATSLKGSSQSTIGGIFNLISVDTQRLSDITALFHMLWIAPLRIAIATFFLYQILGISVFAGLAVTILLIPINGFIANKTKIYQVKQMMFKDSRIQLISEMITDINVLKLFAWEPSFLNLIEKTRTEEIKFIKKAAHFGNSTNLMFSCAPYLVSFATFSTYVLSNDSHNLTVEKIFVALTLFNIIRMPMTILPLIIALIVQSTVSVRRLDDFLAADEINPNIVTHDHDYDENPIVVKDGTFSWSNNSSCLHDISIAVKRRTLVAIVGTTGAGKSSLINAILGNMNKDSGKVNTMGTISYVAQDPWIQNASLKDNILFENGFDKVKYNKVIEVCDLRQDLLSLSAGDDTEIGEKGVNLSGGQKQRVALARAVYNQSDIYLLDDPLSAVDCHVGNNIFDKLIGPNGYLKSSTRIFVTNNVDCLRRVDNILVLRDGRISENGSFNELLHKKGQFSDFLLQHSESEKRRKSEYGDTTFSGQPHQAPKTNTNNLNKGECLNDKETIIAQESVPTTSTVINTFTNYVLNSGLKTSIASLLFHILFQAFSTYSNIWLSEWSSQASKDEISTNGTQVSATTNFYLPVYGGLGIAQGLSLLIGATAITIATLNSAAIIHARVFNSVIKAPVSYFNRIPLGRLVNRFAKDVDIMDNDIPINIRAFLNCLLSVFATVFVISYSTPMFIAFFVPCGIVYFFLQRFYALNSTQLKRLESVTRSPIYSQFSETISGSSTIRAFKLQGDFIKKFERKIDDNQKCYYSFIISTVWITLRLEIIGSLIVFASAIFAVLSRGKISPSIAGISLSYALQITSLLNFLVKTSTDLEANCVSLERLNELINIPQEEKGMLPAIKPEDNWPMLGKVEFRNYYTKYRENLDFVLRGLSFCINPGEKVGIVGRTGAGKSSLALSLFRLVEPTSGSIHIDDIDISKTNLYDLRSRLTIIPQKPALFTGSLRFNIDPTSNFTDNEIWKCIELAHLKEFIKSLPNGILHKVVEEGKNFSVGQRQLICLVRALLRKSKVLVLDEATAAIDLETDLLIQKTIRTEFTSCTIITIAHRINTIMDYNRILVLDAGEMKEFDTPKHLLSQPNSMFYGLVKDAGLVQHKQ